MTTPKIKLTYFDGPGRAEPARLAFTLGKIPFEDERLQREEFVAMKKDLPLGQVPILTIDDDIVVTQSHAIARYAAKLANLVPEDPVEALKMDEIVSCSEELLNNLIASMKLPDEERLAARKETFGPGGKGANAIQYFEKLITSDSMFALGDDITLADLFVHFHLALLKSGFFDGLNGDDYTPETLPSHFKIAEAIKADPRLAGYFEEREKAEQAKAEAEKAKAEVDDSSNADA